MSCARVSQVAIRPLRTMNSIPGWRPEAYPPLHLNVEDEGARECIEAAIGSCVVPAFQGCVYVTQGTDHAAALVRLGDPLFCGCPSGDSPFCVHRVAVWYRSGHPELRAILEDHGIPVRRAPGALQVRAQRRVEAASVLRQTREILASGGDVAELHMQRFLLDPRTEPEDWRVASGRASPHTGRLLVRLGAHRACAETRRNLLGCPSTQVVAEALFACPAAEMAADLGVMIARCRVDELCTALGYIASDPARVPSNLVPIHLAPLLRHHDASVRSVAKQLLARLGEAPLPGALQGSANPTEFPI